MTANLAHAADQAIRSKGQLTAGNASNATEHGGERMYKVEYFSIENNCWVRSSMHRNEMSAVANWEVLVQGGKVARIIHEGKIIMSSEVL